MSATLQELGVAARSADLLVADMLDLDWFDDPTLHAEGVAIALSNRNRAVEERQALAFRCAVVSRQLLYDLLREAGIADGENDLAKRGRDVPPTR